MLLEIPSGTVTLTDRRTEHSWQVAVPAFRLADTPLTQADYVDVVGADPSACRGADHPVECVSWWDAVGYCNARSEREGLVSAYVVDEEQEVAALVDGADGYRLPTEAEWEHGCRAGSSGPRPGPIAEIAWYRDNAGEGTRAVRTRTPNAWGLHDMLGNVWEWCWDLYDPEVYGAYRVLKGGGWADPHWSVRTSVRRRSHPTFRIDDLGFRVARSGLRS